MFKHILIPTDGSEVAAKAIEAGLEFARETRAKVTGFIAVEQFHTPTSSAELTRRSYLTADEYEKHARQKAEAVLGRIAERARSAGADFDYDYAQNDHPYEAIIQAAQKHDCDLIIMASHGRGPLGALLHGSETQHVLSRSKIPTLVYR
jgi:nucleotide-binding universal stress UspA family protein